MTVQIASVGPEAAPVLHALHVPLFDNPWSADAIADQLSAPGVTALAADGESLNGFVLFRVAADEAEILIIAVAGHAQRRGLGRRLLESAMESARQAGAVTLWLEVAQDNDSALALYTAAGFEPAGRRPRYYHRTSGPRVDALLLRRRLDATAS